MRMRPYYEADGVTLYRGDCREILPGLARRRCLVIADPPYGIAEGTDRKRRGRSGAAACNDFPPIIGDDKPFDPSPLLDFRSVIWGANHFADKLPPSPSWIVWNKTGDMDENDNSDGELAWTNLGGPLRIITHRWKGMIKESERDVPRLHPTQKPVALGSALIQRYAMPGDLIVEPYMGSGFVTVAAHQLGFEAIGIDIEERYCALVKRRVAQRMLFGAA